MKGCVSRDIFVPFCSVLFDLVNVKRLGSSFTALYMLRTDHIFRYWTKKVIRHSTILIWKYWQYDYFLLIFQIKIVECQVEFCALTKHINIGRCISQKQRQDFWIFQAMTSEIFQVKQQFILLQIKNGQNYASTHMYIVFISIVSAWLIFHNQSFTSHCLKILASDYTTKLHVVPTFLTVLG